MFATLPAECPAGVWRRTLWVTILLISNGMIHGVRAEFSYEAITAVLARINVSYIDSATKTPISVTAEAGRFADGTIRPAGGVLITSVLPPNATNRVAFVQGCVPNWASLPEKGEPWVALLQRGGCSDAEKVKIAMNQNASAVLLYGNDHGAYVQKEEKFKAGAVVVYLLKTKGNQLATLLDGGTKVYISITRGQEVKFRITSINRTSVLFVSVSFIVLMVVSLAWLIFYYIQRFRYINAKDRLARHLNNAAKKALAKIPVKNMKSGDKSMEEGESCAVCIEIYQSGDTLRSLPCKHEFHKGCVDPWLLEHRTCPMCKMDILKYYGYTPSGSEGGATQSSTTDEALEAGGASRNAAPSVERSSRASQGTLQVSVISHSDFLPRSETLTRSFSSPAGDATSSIAQCQPPVTFGATTSVIRSMILSARPKVAVAECCGGDSGAVAAMPALVEVPAVHQRCNSAAVSLKDGDTSKTAATVGGGTEPSSDVTAEVAAEVAAAIAPLNEESGLTNIPEEAGFPEEVNFPPIAESFNYNISSTFTHPVNELPPEAGSLSPQPPTTSQPLTQDRVSEDHVVCDIESLVQEIFDLEKEASHSRSSKGSVTKPPFSRQSSAILQEVASDSVTSQSNIQSECPTNPPNQAALPIVDIDPMVQYTSGNSANLSQVERRPSRNETEDVFRRGSTSLPDERRPSSHLVTISHS